MNHGIHPMRLAKTTTNDPPAIGAARSTASSSWHTELLMSWPWARDALLSEVEPVDLLRDHKGRLRPGRPR